MRAEMTPRQAVYGARRGSVGRGSTSGDTAVYGGKGGKYAGRAEVPSVSAAPAQVRSAKRMEGEVEVLVYVVSEVFNTLYLEQAVVIFCEVVAPSIASIGGPGQPESVAEREGDGESEGQGQLTVNPVRIEQLDRVVKDECIWYEKGVYYMTVEHGGSASETANDRSLKAVSLLPSAKGGKGESVCLPLDREGDGLLNTSRKERRSAKWRAAEEQRPTHQKSRWRGLGCAARPRAPHHRVARSIIFMTGEEWE